MGTNCIVQMSKRSTYFLLDDFNVGKLNEKLNNSKESKPGDLFSKTQPRGLQQSQVVTG